jgi:hypothetical protein
MNQSLKFALGVAFISLLIFSPRSAFANKSTVRVFDIHWQSLPANVSQTKIDSWTYQLKESLIKHGFIFDKDKSVKSNPPEFLPVKDHLIIRLVCHFRAYHLEISCHRNLENEQIGQSKERLLFLDEVPASLVKQSRSLLKPIGRLIRQSKMSAVLKLSGLWPKNLKRGGVFRLVRRRRGRERGKAIPWTLFEVSRVNRDKKEVSGQIRTGKVWTNDQRRYDDFAIPLNLDRRVSLQFLLVDRGEGLPLRGYQIYERRGAQDEYRGVTDGRGRLDLRFDKEALTELQIRFNSLILASFPVAPARQWEGKVLCLRLKRREDLSKFHIELSRIRKQVEELLLLREVALEDVQRLIAERKYVAAQKILKTFKGDAQRINSFKRRVKVIEMSAKSARQNISAFVRRLEGQMARDEKRLDVTLIEAQLTAMKDRVLARSSSESLVLEANSHLADNNVPMAISKLKRACLADPGWATPKEKLANLVLLWEVKSPDHRRARDLILLCGSWDWRSLAARMVELKAAVSELKKHKDALALRGALRTLTKQLSDINDEAKKCLGNNQLKEAKALSKVSLELGPVVDEISAFLNTLASESRSRGSVKLRKNQGFPAKKPSKPK